MRGRRAAGWLAALLLLGCGAEEEPPPPLEPGFTALFDGESLAGWRKVGGGATYEVDDGHIVGTVGPGANTFLRSERSFGDFVLRLDVRLDVPGNSGVQFRSHQRGGDGLTYGYQFEIDPSERAWSCGVYDESRRGWLATLEGRPEAQRAFRPDAWNELEIRAEGPRIRTFLNGTPCVDLVDVADLEGFVALQVHAGEQGVIRWRRIRIQELGSSAERWKPAWEGDDLNLFRASAALDWSLEGGLLRARAPADAPALLLSSREYRDVALRVEARAVRGRAELVLRSQRVEPRELDGLALGVAADTGAGLGDLTRLSDGARLASPDPQRIEAADAEGFRALSLAAVGGQLAGDVGGARVGHSEEALAPTGRLAIALAPGAELELRAAQVLDLRPESDETPFYKTIQVPPAPVLSPEQALTSFRLAPGFRIELVAAEPLVEDPVAMVWDARGDLYVVEMRGYMPDAYGNGELEPVGRVVRLEDTDGDGVMDESHVFLDGLVNPRAIAPAAGGLLIAEPPHLWLCRDQGGAEDGIACDEKLRLADYADPNPDELEHTENGLVRGLDNWIYNAKSDRRLRFDGDALSEERTVFRGQWGIAQDDAGRLYANTNSQFLLVDLIPAHYAFRHAGADPDGPHEGLMVGLANDARVHSVRVNPGVNRAYVEGVLRPDGRLDRPTGASGMAVLRDDRFGAEARGDVFVGEVAGNAVARFRIRESEPGAARLVAEHLLYEDPDWEQREFLASTDERFRPVDLRLGPDGALYVIDMYRGIIQHRQFVTDELREQIFERGLDAPIGLGRIWRVVPEGDAAGPRPAPALDTADEAELVAALSETNGWWRDTAQRLLVERRPKAALPLLRDLSRHAPPGRVHALFALAGMEALDAGTVQRALADEDFRVRIAALRAAEPAVASDPALRDAALAAVPPTAPERARLQLLLSLGLAPENRALLVDRLDADVENALFRQAALFGFAGDEPAVLATLLADPRWEVASDGRAALLRAVARASFTVQRQDPAAVAALLDAVQAELPARPWRAAALLDGIASGSRGEKPVTLAGPHPLFAPSDEEDEAAVPLPDEIVQAALRGARRAITWPGDELAPGAIPLTTAQRARMEAGAALYESCAICHQASGLGQEGLAPSLVQSPWVLGPPEWLARIVLQGLAGPVVIDGVEWNGVMPGHGRDARFAEDEAVAGLLTWLRRAWGHTATAVDPPLVAEVRTATRSRTEPWTVAELRAVPFDPGFDELAGTYRIAGMPIWIEVTPAEDHLLFAATGQGESRAVPRDDGAFDLEGTSYTVRFLRSDQGKVDRLLLDVGAQKVEAKRTD